MSNSLFPLQDRVIIQPDEAVKVSEGGIYIPDTAQERPTTGTVIAAGKGTPERPSQLNAGDRVIYSPTAGQLFPWDDNRFIVLRETEIFARI